jgi:hypothetical protein
LRKDCRLIAARGGAGRALRGGSALYESGTCERARCPKKDFACMPARALSREAHAKARTSEASARVVSEWFGFCQQVRLSPDRIIRKHTTRLASSDVFEHWEGK